MLNKLKNFRALVQDAFVECLTPGGEQDFFPLRSHQASLSFFLVSFFVFCNYMSNGQRELSAHFSL